MLTNAAAQSGLALAFLKMFGELVQAGVFAENLPLGITIGVLMVISMWTQTVSLNNAMKYYDQLEVMPIFQAMIMMMWMLGGMVVLQEANNYTWNQLWGIFASFCVSCVGIYLLISKIKT